MYWFSKVHCRINTEEILLFSETKKIRGLSHLSIYNIQCTVLSQSNFTDFKYF